MPTRAFARRHRLHAAWALACALVAAPAFGFDTLAENALIASLREEAIGLELGNGLEKDPERAAKLYCEAARLGDSDSQFRLGWMYTNGNGVERSDRHRGVLLPDRRRAGLRAGAAHAAGGGRPDHRRARVHARAAPAAKAATAVAMARSCAEGARSRRRRTSSTWSRRSRRSTRCEPQLALAIIEAESNSTPWRCRRRTPRG